MAGSDGHKTGALEPVCGDTGTDEPASGTVTAGLGRLVFVPLAGAIVGPGYLKVAYARR